MQDLCQYASFHGVAIALEHRKAANEARRKCSFDDCLNGHSGADRPVSVEPGDRVLCQKLPGTGNPLRTLNGSGNQDPGGGASRTAWLSQGWTGCLIVDALVTSATLPVIKPWSLSDCSQALINVVSEIRMFLTETEQRMLAAMNNLLFLRTWNPSSGPGNAINYANAA
jgi:hypothetical protein